MVGDLAKKGLAGMISGGQPNAQKVAAAQQAQIDKVAKQALPQWMAKRSQLEKTLGAGQVNFDEELEAWLEDNVLRNYLKFDNVDPKYKTAIDNQIRAINSTTNDGSRLEQFKKLLTTSIMARPSRAQASQASGVIPTKIDPSSNKISIGKYTLNPNDKNDAVMIALLKNLQQQGKL